MEITIHRGINQIGGAIVEISTSNASIIIDLGQNLPNGNGEVIDEFANKKTIAELTTNVDAIFYTHYHGDHVGLFNLVPDGVIQYIGGVAKQVMLAKHTHLSYSKKYKKKETENVALITKMIGYKAEEIIKIKNITITPYFVSHSAADAHMFVIEADGKRILHTGDFRGHGYLSKGLFKVIERLILPKGKIDFLITEGTMLSRLKEKVMTENELKQEAKKIMKQYKNVFVMSSSTDMERLASFHSANKESGKWLFVTDNFQKSILNVFSETSGKVIGLFNFGKIYDYDKDNVELNNYLKNEGFCMMVRASSKSKKFVDYYNVIKKMLNDEDTILIYSMWSQYINPKSKHLNKAFCDFVNMFSNMIKLHTSGHASAETLAKLCNRVNPTLGIIPIHSEHSANYKRLDINDNLKERIISKTQVIDNVSVKLNINFTKTLLNNKIVNETNKPT